ncbi:MAG TPA: CAP domain-containing protein [Acidimicrobiia bacterium]|nr:CAP domain-containing protein [Acidimicrobiia bacterium]
MKRINNLRASEGRDALAVSSSLKSYARDWSEEMATSGEFRHSDIGAYITTTNWSTIGENIGRGGSVSAIFNALVDSSPHLANMLNPDFTHIGVGVYVDAEGVLWTTHVFGG